MSTQLSNDTATLAGGSIGENSRVARIKRVYEFVPVGTKVKASNDVMYRTHADSAQALDAWARRSAAANGFGDAPVQTGATAGPRTVVEVSEQARNAGQAGLGEIMMTIVDAVAARLHKVAASWRRARDTRATQRALEHLDARALRDIGFDRSEVSSVSVELAGGAPLTRIRALMTLRDLSY